MVQGIWLLDGNVVLLTDPPCACCSGILFADIVVLCCLETNHALKILEPFLSFILKFGTIAIEMLKFLFCC